MIRDGRSPIEGLTGNAAAFIGLSRRVARAFLAISEERVYDYQVIELIRAVDGDTYDLRLAKRINLGFYLRLTFDWAMRFRLLGADTWETNQAGGAAATQAAAEWLRLAINDDVLRGQTEKTDHFGRWLIDLYRTDSQEHLAKYLLDGGHLKVKS